MIYFRNFTKYMRNLFLYGLILIFSVSLYADPAPQGIIKNISLPDGSVKLVCLKGDEDIHYWESADNEIFMEDKGVFRKISKEDLKQKIRNIKSQREEFSIPAMLKMPEKTGKLPTFETSNFVYTGKMRVPVILVEFPDVKFQSENHRELFERIFNTVGFNELEDFRGSVKDYFLAQSNGLYEPEFDIIGPITVSQPKSYYGHDEDDQKDVNSSELAIEVVSLLDEDIDLSVYDFDSDKRVEVVSLVIAGNSQTYSGDPDDIWGKSMSVNTHKGEYKFNKFLFTSELRTFGNEVKLNSIGQICHEFSHFLGLGDTYSDYEGDYALNGWDLMGHGLHNENGHCPSGFTAFGKIRCGWQSPVVLDDSVDIYDMPALTDGGDFYMIMNEAYTDEFFLLENRQQRGWDSAIPGHGLLITHIDYDENLFSSVPVNNTGREEIEHERYAVIPADNDKSKNPESIGNDAYPFASNDSFSDITVPSAELYHPNLDFSCYLHKSVNDIRENDEGLISFSFRNELPYKEIYFLSSFSKEIRRTSYNSIKYTVEICNGSKEPFQNSFECRIYEKGKEDSPFGIIKINALIQGRESEIFDFNFDNLSENATYILKICFQDGKGEWHDAGREEIIPDSLPAYQFRKSEDYMAYLNLRDEVVLKTTLFNDSFLPYDNRIGAFTYKLEEDNYVYQSPKDDTWSFIEPYGSNELSFVLRSLKSDFTYYVMLYYLEDGLWLPISGYMPVNVNLLEYIDDSFVENVFGEEPVPFRVVGNEIYFTGHATVSGYNLYDRAGKLVMSGKDDSVRVSSNGLYLLQIEGETFKILIR